MIDRRTALLLLGLLLVALPAAAQSSTDGWYLDPPETAGNLAGGGNGGDAGGPWPGGASATRIVPKKNLARTMNAAALPLPRGLFLAWPAWDGHDTEIVLAVIGGSSGTRAIRVTRNGGRDEEPFLVAGDGTVLLSWVHREKARGTLRAVRLALDGTPAGDEVVLGPAGRARLVGVLPGGRAAALVLRGPAGRARALLLVEGRRQVTVARLGRDGGLLDATPGPGGTLVFRFRDGSLVARLTVGPGGIVRDLAWGED